MEPEPTPTPTPTKSGAVFVSGANGFIGSWLVRALLDAGYATVRASVFPGSDASHLLSLPGASPSRLLLFEADVLDATAVARAIDGCEGVFHVASPCTLEGPKDPESELLLPAVQGTLNILEAARRSGVRRVVLTSSISALVPNLGWPPHKPFDESSWTDLDYCKSRQKWYPVSKTLAEKAAWEFAKKHGLDVVAINPSTCLGLYCNRVSTQAVVCCCSCFRDRQILRNITGSGLSMLEMWPRLKSCCTRHRLRPVDISAQMVSISSVILLKGS
ncbi:hypothetical protein BT93_L4216 [Corymbia citriodora subsp. variegata]|uniref:NAD-dependent epimerase/dehydratase domain-containing protein n=1 Tax=Corymbia citriodora subsp. variegata TaxID=360336 RepID=A0A8T0CL52_CORYI|nr:hypothetical protein BT93_L4216 [Corymbia citriodora subsp. variegata]